MTDRPPVSGEPLWCRGNCLTQHAHRYGPPVSGEPPHEHRWAGPDNVAPYEYCSLCSVPRHHQHHVHEKRRVTDCPECIGAATAFLSEGAAPRAEGLDVEKIVRATLLFIDQTTPLSVGEPLIQKAIRYATNLSRLTSKEERP